jgi:hypothetical protein
MSDIAGSLEPVWWMPGQKPQVQLCISTPLALIISHPMDPATGAPNRVLAHSLGTAENCGPLF